MPIATLRHIDQAQNDNKTLLTRSFLQCFNAQFTSASLCSLACAGISKLPPASGYGGRRALTTRYAQEATVYGLHSDGFFLSCRNRWRRENSYRVSGKAPRLTGRRHWCVIRRARRRRSLAARELHGTALERRGQVCRLHHAVGGHEGLCARTRRPRLKQDCDQAGPGPERDASDQI